jgi:hypothetical protein
MTKDELKLALEALKELVAQTEARLFAVKHDHIALQNAREAITAIKTALEQPEEEKLHTVHIGVDVTTEGTAVTAFYRKPDAVMEMFYAQFHPLVQPEQPEVRTGNCFRVGVCASEGHKIQPQRTWVGLTDEAKSVIDAARAAMDNSVEAYDSEGSIKISSHLAASLSLCLDEYDRAIEAAHGITGEKK